MLKKMRTTLASPVEYTLDTLDGKVHLNDYLSKKITLTYSGKIQCLHCNRSTSKSFAQGHCYPCFRSLAACDLCIMKPETCHHAQGTCREPSWGETHCMQEHIVYLANTSGLKVGITRKTQIPTRWMDQGATQALPIFSVSTRLQSGLVEHILKQHVADKTNWRKILKGNAAPLDLAQEQKRLISLAQNELDALIQREPAESMITLNADIQIIDYPVLTYPEKISSLSFDKTPVVSGHLLGIKGQYLLLNTGVINIRKFGGYLVNFAG